jgi:hypothetical protein
VGVRDAVAWACLLNIITFRRGMRANHKGVSEEQSLRGKFSLDDPPARKRKAARFADGPRGIQW